MSAANRGISALNQIMGFNDFCQHPPSEAQALALDEIKAAYPRRESAAASVGEPPTGGAIRELCGGSSSYTGERADLKPLAEELISWPPLGSSPVRLEDALGAADRQWLGQWQPTMLRSETDVLAVQQAKLLTQAGRYIDPALKHNRSKYVSFIRQMQKRGMIRFKIGTPKSVNLGVFCVAKKKGSLRLIVDTRFLNSVFKDPPKTDLPTANSFTRIQSKLPK